MDLGINYNHCQTKEQHSTKIGVSVQLIAQINQSNFYDRLGVPVRANLAQITRSYHRLSLRVHPDRCSNVRATQFMQLLNEAYTCLKDPDSRAVYDAQESWGRVSIPHCGFSDDDDSDNELDSSYSAKENSSDSLREYLRQVFLGYGYTIHEFLELDVSDTLATGFAQLSSDSCVRVSVACVRCPITSHFQFDDFGVWVFTRNILCFNQTQSNSNLDVGINELKQYLQHYHTNQSIKRIQISNAKRLVELIWLYQHNWF